MKSSITLFTLLAVVLAQAVSAQALPKVGLFTTGGTIQSKGNHRQKLMEYSDGRVTPEELLADLPELKELAEISVFEISNVGSPSVNTEILLKLVKGINEWLARPDTSGAVVTHGTGTLEETAYFLNLTVKSDKPVVVIGAMRPFTAVSRDGPFNLYDATRVAASAETRGYGVMILLNNEINAARETTKSNTYRVETFVARDFGPLGYVDTDLLAFYRKPTTRHTVNSEFDVSSMTTLPKVDIVYGYQEADPAPIYALAEAGSKGIIYADGSPAFREAIEAVQKEGVVVVAGDRKGSGRVLNSERMAERKIVTSDNLNPQKARILLRLALTKTSDPAEIQRIFNEY